MKSILEYLNEVIDKTKEIDKRWNELKKLDKKDLLEIYKRSHKVTSVDMKTPKIDLKNDIIDDEFGWKYYKKDK